MSFVEAALSKQAKEAIGEGLITAIETWNLQKGIDAMFLAGERNGAVPMVKIGLVLDILNEIAEAINQR